MKITKEVREINRENHSFWHLFWTRNIWESSTRHVSFIRPRVTIRKDTSYCTKKNCGWEKTITTSEEVELQS